MGFIENLKRHRLTIFVLNKLAKPAEAEDDWNNPIMYAFF